MKKRASLVTLVQVAVLIAMEVILSRFFSITTPLTKVSLAFVPLSICAMLFGPVWSGVAGGVADLIGATLFPVGPYFPGFTISSALYGVSLGIFLHRKNCRWWQVAAALVINHLIVGVFLSAYWMHLLYGSPYWGMVPVRAIQGIVLTPVQFVVIRLMQRPVEQYRARMGSPRYFE